MWLSARYLPVIWLHWFACVWKYCSLVSLKETATFSWKPSPDGISWTKGPLPCILMFSSLQLRQQKMQDLQSSPNLRFLECICFSSHKTLESWHSGPKRFSAFCPGWAIWQLCDSQFHHFLSHICLKRARNCLWFNARALMKFTILATTLMTWFIFSTDLNNRFWCIIQCKNTSSVPLILNPSQKSNIYPRQIWTTNHCDICLSVLFKT